LARIGLGGILFALVLELLFSMKTPLHRSRGVRAILSVTLGLSSALLLGALVFRSRFIGFPALTNLYEGLLFLTSAILAVLFFHTLNQGPSSVIRGGLLLSLVLLILASSPLIPDTIAPPIPALRSSWLVLHVALAFVGEALFAIGFVAAALWFVTGDPEKKNSLDRLVYRSILAGYPLFTMGALVFGAVWASHAWGRFWSWDPKETWALITWLTYTLYLHARLISRQNPRVCNLIALAGFLFTLVTFLGVKYVSFGAPSLHSY